MSALYLFDRMSEQCTADMLDYEDFNLSSRISEQIGQQRNLTRQEMDTLQMRIFDALVSLRPSVYVEIPW